MKNRDHYLCGLGIYTVVLNTGNFNNTDYCILFLYAPFLSFVTILPNLCDLLNKQTSESFHRSFRQAWTHGPLSILIPISLLLFLPFENVSMSNYFTNQVLILWFSHLLLDMSDKEGIPLSLRHSILILDQFSTYNDFKLNSNGKKFRMSLFDREQPHSTIVGIIGALWYGLNIFLFISPV